MDAIKTTEANIKVFTNTDLNKLQEAIDAYLQNVHPSRLIVDMKLSEIRVGLEKHTTLVLVTKLE